MCYLCLDKEVLSANLIIKEKIKVEYREYMENNILLELKKFFVKPDLEKEFSLYSEDFLENVIFSKEKFNIVSETVRYTKRERIEEISFVESTKIKLELFFENKNFSDHLKLVYKRYAYFIELFLTSSIYSIFNPEKNHLSLSIYEIYANSHNKEVSQDEQDELQKNINYIGEKYQEIKSIMEGDLSKVCLSKRTIETELKYLDLPDFSFIKDKIEFYYIRDKAEKIYQKFSEFNKISYLYKDISERIEDVIVKEIKTLDKNEIYENNKLKILSPYSISSELKKSVKGQDHIVDLLSLAGYQQLMKMNGNIKNKNKIIEMIIGDTGTGKTFLIRELANFLGLPYRIIPVTSFTTEGWQGANLSEMLLETYEKPNGEYSLIFFDEIDKTNNAQNDEQHNQVNTTLQNELLTVIEGQQFENNVDTSNMMFILGGSFDEFVNKKIKTIGFSSLEENKSLHDKILDKSKFLQFGLKKELLGRVQNILQLNKLTDDVLREILFAEKGFLEYYNEYFESHNILIEWGDDFIDYILKEHSIKGNEFGARYLNDLLYKNLRNLMLKASFQSEDEQSKEKSWTVNLALINK